MRNRCLHLAAYVYVYRVDFDLSLTRGDWRKPYARSRVLTSQSLGASKYQELRPQTVDLGLALPSWSSAQSRSWAPEMLTHMHAHKLFCRELQPSEENNCRRPFTKKIVEGDSF